jgi:hypothetical protein
MFEVVQVPDGAGRLVLLLGIAAQPTENDAALFDGVAVHPLHWRTTTAPPAPAPNE